MNTTADQLQTLFNNNFVAYYRSHLAHVNVIGRHFQSDHELFGEIYRDLQTEIDTIAELLRTIDEFMPTEIQAVLNLSEISTGELDGPSEYLLQAVRNDLIQLKLTHQQLMEVADEEEYDEIENYAQDRILKLGKFIWKLNSVLD